MRCYFLILVQAKRFITFNCKYVADCGYYVCYYYYFRFRKDSWGLSTNFVYVTFVGHNLKFWHSRHVTVDLIFRSYCVQRGYDLSGYKGSLLISITPKPSENFRITVMSLFYTILPLWIRNKMLTNVHIFRRCITIHLGLYFKWRCYGSHLISSCVCHVKKKKRYDVGVASNGVFVLNLIKIAPLI
jgi:hypothetical protein